MIFGTPEYMSPEQAQGSPPDHRVDIYAVGCIMYHMLTGQVPFTADNFMGILTKHLLEAPVPPRKRRPDLDIAPDVEAICLKAMEKDRDKRYADMDALYRALGARGRLRVRAVGRCSSRRGCPRRASSIRRWRPPTCEARESRTAIAVVGVGDVRGRAAGARLDEAAGGKPQPAIDRDGRRAASRWASAALVFALKPSSKAQRRPRPAAAAKPRRRAGRASRRAARARRRRGHAGRGGDAGRGAEAAPRRRDRRPADDVEAEPLARVTAPREDEEPKPDPLHRAIPVPAETSPAEIKPFPTN